MTIAEKYRRDTATEARDVYRTEDEAHPGAARLYRPAKRCRGGRGGLLNWPQPREFPEFRHTPVQSC